MPKHRITDDRGKHSGCLILVLILVGLGLIALAGNALHHLGR